MKRGGNKDLFERFEAKQSAKRQGKKTAHTVSAELTVQRIVWTPVGRLKKYEPLDTREFVSFKGFF